jgi:small subunit ribosomal protein S7
MPRRREVPERVIASDPKYNSALVAKFINCIMRDGKKSVAESTLYKALDIMGEKTSEPPLKMFEQAVDNVRPLIEVKSRRVGGSTYQVPTEIRPSRRTALGIRWIITFARQRPEKGMAIKLASELLDAANRKGASVKKKEDTHRMAEANKAFAHFRW